MTHITEPIEPMTLDNFVSYKLWVLFVFRCANTGSRSVHFSHVGARFRVSVIRVVTEMIKLGIGVRPNDRINGTMRLGLCLG